MTALALEPASTLSPAERAALFTAGYENYLIPFAVDEAALRFMEHAFDTDLDTSRIAHVDGELAGIANLAARGADAWVAGIGVVVRHRGGGVGRALMEALAVGARKRGCARVWLEVIEGNDPATRLYKKLGYRAVRTLDVWSLPGSSGSRQPAAPLEDARAVVRAHRAADEPWQRSDGTVDRLAELQPPPEGIVVDGGAAVIRASGNRVSILQLAAEDDAALRTLLDAARAGADAVSIVNLPVDDPAAAVLRDLGGGIGVRQHELVLEL